MPVISRSRRWTLPELTLLSRMAASRASADDIARVLGRTVSAVRMKAAHQRVNLPLSGRQQPPPMERLAPPHGRKEP